MMHLPKVSGLMYVFMQFYISILGGKQLQCESCSMKVPLLEFSENIEAILEHLKTFFLNVVVMSPPPVHV